MVIGHHLLPAVSALGESDGQAARAIAVRWPVEEGGD